MRIISSIFLITVVVSFNYLGSYYFLLLLTVTFFILLIEYYKLFDLRWINFSFFINLILILINFLFIYSNFNLLPILLTIFGIFLGILLNRNNCLVPIFSYFYLALPFYILIYVNQYYWNGKIIIFWLFSIVWASDSSAYVFGSIIKGKKFFPSISPNKTWAGFVASLVFASMTSGVFSYYYNIVNIYIAMLAGTIIGLFTSFGDLFESYLKRINNKKDTSKLIPGHGGILDRLDGFLFAIVVMFIFIYFGVVVEKN
ncbi:MAG: phosphatidate cytidylyltransferase [Pseudomonadota bacterium]|nr:phosphatidate cytidylyltransferase [Pseudomonadota bacterium]